MIAKDETYGFPSGLTRVEIVNRISGQVASRLSASRPTSRALPAVVVESRWRLSG